MVPGDCLILRTTHMARKRRPLVDGMLTDINSKMLLKPNALATALMSSFVACLALLSPTSPIAPRAAWGQEAEAKDKVEVNAPAAAPAPAPAPAKAKFERPFVIRIEGTITPLTLHYLERKLERAQQAKADLVVIEIDSPGGMVGPTLDMATKLSGIDWARTAAFVPREALSGGAIMALGCDDIYLHPQAKFGDAGPIFMNEGAVFEHAPEKFRTHLVRHVRDLATAKHRPPALAEAMVDKDLVVFRVRNKTKGDIHYMSDSELQSDAKPDDWEKLEPVQETQDGNFLEVNGRRAVDLGLANGLADDREALKKLLAPEADWTDIRPDFADLAVYILNTTFVTILLILVGLIALYFEFSSPGIGVGGLIATFCFTLFFWSRFLGGTSGWLEVILFLSGLAFLAVEIFVLPGFGFAGIAGIILIVVSLVLASQSFIVPTTASEMGIFTNSLTVLLVSMVLFTAAAVLISRHLGAIPVFNRLVLAAPDQVDVLDDEDEADGGGGGGASRPGSQASDLPRVNDVGRAETPLRPAGKARFAEQLVDVVADGTFIDRGRQVRVVDQAGSRIVVVDAGQPQV